MPETVLSDRYQVASDLMEQFAKSTGVGADAPPTRYLWTDAFAVCNYLGLHSATAENHYFDLALDLVAQVHDVLGRHRRDDPRIGWISGLTAEEGRRHPTVGGLRIGKPLHERRPEEPFDAQQEWERDGQYYHYLTKWMHALHRVWQVTGDETYHRWAVELAEATTERFLVGPKGQESLCWKMSIDLSRPLVPSSGLHDPLDGWVTTRALIAQGPAPIGPTKDRLSSTLQSLERMCRDRTWVTDDALGAGSLLVDAHRCYGARPDSTGPIAILPGLLNDAFASLEAASASAFWQQAAHRRLAFRELGLSIGIRAAQRLTADASAAGPGLEDLSLRPTQAEVEVLERYELLADQIEGFWMDPANQHAAGWSEHREISRVMLATSLAPEGYLGA